MTITIYFDENKKSRQVIHPSDKFDNQVTQLVEAITRSDLSEHRKNYHSFEILN